jgi:DNA-binding MarR family transcriptional regulator
MSKITSRSKIAPPKNKPIESNAHTELASDHVVDTAFLETLIGYNSRRGALHLIAGFSEAMADLGLSPVEFSVLSIVHHNPGITSRIIAKTLAIQPPNLVVMIRSLEQRQWIKRKPYLEDKRAIGLHITTSAVTQIKLAESIAFKDDQTRSNRLTKDEKKTLNVLLKKMYSDA